MDEEYKESRAVRLGYRPQKENVYNNLLPYASYIDEESEKLFVAIKTNLVKSVLGREIRPGCSLWTSRLNKYIKIYGLKFSKEDHIALVKLFYELLIMPDLDPTRINKCAFTLSLLLKKRYLLSRDELQLDWRPLYDLLDRTCVKTKSNIGMYRYYASFETTLYSAVRSCKIYFPASATQEILDEFRPKLCPFNDASMLQAVQYLELLLPNAVKHEEADISYKLWFNEFMALLEVCPNTNAWENNMMWILSGLARFQTGLIDWTPHVPAIFARFLRSSSLPVNYRQLQIRKQSRIDIGAMAIWIVFTLRGDETPTFFYLEKLMQALESYFQPANSGRWSQKLREFLKKLSYFFVQRVHVERYHTTSWDNQVPEHFKLTDADIDRFVNILKPCIQLAVLTRSRFADVSLALSYLSSLRPNLIIPEILDNFYSSMDSLTEPHKFTANIEAMAAVGRYMIRGAEHNYPEGPTNVIPILLAILPGIDPNDFHKSMVTVIFINRFVSMIPLIDSSKAHLHYNDLSEEEHMICEASAELEDFVLQFFDRMFVWIESNSLDFVRLEQSTSNINKEPSLVEYEFSHVIGILLTQCSPSIFHSALRKFYNFVTEKILEVKVAGKLVGEVVRQFSLINPVETLKLFLPYLFNFIEDAMLENPHISEEEHVDPKFLFNLQVLSEVVDGRQELVNYLDKLMRILDQTLHMACVDVQLLSARMLDLMLSSLTKLRPTEHRSSTVDYGTSLDNFLSVREWAKSYKIYDVNINWYIPKEPEIKAVQTLVEKYLIPELGKLNSWANKEISLSRQELKCSLKIVLSVLSCHLLLPIWEEPPYELMDTILDPWAFNLMVLNEGKVTLPDGQNVRKAVIDTMHKVQKMLLNIDEGDTQSLKHVINIYNVVVFNKTQNQDFDMHWRTFHTTKKRMEDRLHQKKLHMRYLHMDRVMLQQEFRIESRSCLFTETHKQILEDLWELAISRYSEVRLAAQSKLNAIIEYFPFSFTVLKEKFKEILQIDTVVNHETFKGCLYILLSPKTAPILTRHDWNFIKEIWPLIVTSMPSEKPSIINLISALEDAVNLYFPTMAINLTIPDRALQVAYDLAKTKPYICDLTGFQKHIDNGEAYLEQRSLERKNAYEETIDCLLAHLETGNLHWRYTGLAITFIKNLVHYDVKYNSKLVRYFLKATISESIIIRKSAIKVLLYITIQNKPKFHKIEVDPYQFSKSTNNKVLIPGEREDNMWLLYDPKTVPTTAAQWEESRYLHDQNTGYYAWPKHLMVYAPPSQQKTVASRLNNMSATEKEIYDFFKNEENVAQLINYLSLEEEKGIDRFNLFRFLAFKNIFKMFEDELLPIFLPHIERLVEDKQESSQICAAELIAAVIRGSKHWSFEKTEKLWKSFIPFLNTAIANIGNETLYDWTLCITMAFQSRDPNRCYWLLESLADDPLKDPTSFMASSRLHLLCIALRQQSWRNVRIFTKLVKYFKPHLTNPFENIRDRISQFLVVFYGSDLIFPAGTVSQGPRIEDLFSEVAPKLEQLFKYFLRKAEISGESDMEANCDTLSIVTSEKEKEELMRLFKVVARYSSISMMRLNFSTRPVFWKLLPLSAVLQNVETDEELNKVTIILAALAQSITNKEYMLDAIAAIKEVVNCPLWSARTVIAEFLPVFVFYNLPTLQSCQDWVLQIQELVLQLLEDPQPEVRIQAAKVLSGFLHCQFISKPTELLPTFKQKASTKIRKGKPLGETSNTGKTLISQRHAGILGLCSFIDAHPYDVPDYFPTIFETLGRHLNDPQPIPATIHKTMGDFKRTHHDNWELHKLKFTDDELLVLSDLSLPPSYCI